METIIANSNSPVKSQCLVKNLPAAFQVSVMSRPEIRFDSKTSCFIRVRPRTISRKARSDQLLRHKERQSTKAGKFPAVHFTLRCSSPPSLFAAHSQFVGEYRRTLSRQS